MSQEEQLRSIRRIVTAQGADGKSKIVSNGSVPHVTGLPDGTEIAQMWLTDTVPEIIAQGQYEPTREDLPMNPPLGGIALKVSDIAPFSRTQAIGQTAEEMFQTLGGLDALPEEQRDPRGVMHRTDSVDYVVMISGSITLVLDDEEIILFPGDIVVQLSTNHLWYNHTEQFARAAFVMVGAKCAD